MKNESAAPSGGECAPENPGLLAQTLHMFDSRLPRQPSHPLAYVLAFLILLLASGGMLWLGDKFNASGMAMTRFMARAQAPLTANHYSAQARDRITVLMYDQEFLAANQLAWPLSYQQHADGLLRLTQDPAARPHAIFLDVTFGQQRDDATVAALRRALCTVQNEHHVPVFLAALVSPDTGQLVVRRDLMSGDGSQDSKPCFTLVGVDYLPDTLDGIAWTYVLTRHHDADGWEAGPATAPGQPMYRSAALAMAQDAGRLDLGPETVPMALVWGKASSPLAHRPQSQAGCRPGEFQWGSLIPGVLRQIWEGTPAPLCPYHATLSMAQVNELADADLATYLNDRFVLIGAQVPGYNDFARSPVHGLVPGIQMHAMALDNLLVYGDRYKQSEEWSWHPPFDLWAPALLAVVAVFLVQMVWTGLGRWAQAAQYLAAANPGQKISRWKAAALWLLQARQEATGSGHGARAWHAFTGALGWLARLWVKTLAAMAAIALLQDWFRIGMLPVAELVGMTLVAEALGYMPILQRYLLAHDTDKATGNGDAASANSPPDAPPAAPPATPSVTPAPVVPVPPLITNAHHEASTQGVP